MASIYKPLGPNDITTVRDLLHEAIPVTGTLVSGTYGDLNIKNYTPNEELFQSVYDYPFLSSSANHIFDLSAGFSPQSSLSGTAGKKMEAQKLNIYNELSMLLAGFNESGSIRQFDRDGDLAGGSKLKDVFFINFSRLLVKDEIQKQTFTVQLLTGSTVSDPTNVKTISDYGARTAYRTNSPVGEYGILYTSSASPVVAGTGVGLIYYQAGIAVLTASVFDGNAASYIGNNGAGGTTSNYETVSKLLVSASVSGCCDALRNRLHNISFNNTTEINSTIYFCRANFNEYNYSSNPTYLSASQIRVKSNAQEMPRAYITSVGLYNSNSELLAVGKLSAPLQKDPTDEVVIRVRLDY